MDKKHRIRRDICAARDAIDPTERDRRSALICDELFETIEDAGVDREQHIALYWPMKSEVDVRPLARRALQAGWPICFPVIVKRPEGSTSDTSAGACSAGVPDEGESPYIAANASDEKETPDTGISTKQDTQMIFVSLPDGNLKTALSESVQPRSTEKVTEENSNQPPKQTSGKDAQRISTTLPFFAHPARALEADDPALNGCRIIMPDQMGAVVVPMVACDFEGGRLGYGGGYYDRFLPQLPADCLVLGVAFSEQQRDSIPKEDHDQPLDTIVTG